MVQRQHNVSEPIPPFYVQTLVSLEASLVSALAKEKEAKKKMNATNAKALTAMKQKVKKATKENEAEVKRYQEVGKPRSPGALDSTFSPRIQKHSSANTPQWWPTSLLHPFLPVEKLPQLEAVRKSSMTLPLSEKEARSCNSRQRVFSKISKLSMKLVAKKYVNL